MRNKSRTLNIMLGPMLLAICLFLLPNEIFSSMESKAAIGVVAWMAYWWVTGPIDYAVTAFLPIAINALFSICDMSLVISNYASETILLLLGTSILTISWEETGLDQRIAALFLGFVGDKLRNQLIFWFLISAILSGFLPNAVVCATVTPIAVSMLRYVGEGDISKSKFGSKLLLTIAYATGVGGLLSPLGGAMNLVTVEYIQILTGKEYMYIEWFGKFLPIVLVLVISNIIYILRNVGRDDRLGGSRDYFRKRYHELPPMRFEEVMSLILFLVATTFAFTRQFYKDVFPDLKPAYVFIICAIVSFLITKKDGKKLMSWKSVQGKIVWELIYVFAGGFAVGTLINESGAAKDLGDLVFKMGLGDDLLSVFIVLTITILLSDMTSNTATAAVVMPILISIAGGMTTDPLKYIYTAAVGVNLSYMLPTSIRAIPVGYGLNPKYMLKEGVALTAIVILLMTVMCYWLLF